MITVRAQTLHHEQETKAQIWRIEHNMGAYPVISVCIRVGGKMETILPKSIKHESKNVTEIEFSRPRAGFANLS